MDIVFCFECGKKFPSNAIRQHVNLAHKPYRRTNRPRPKPLQINYNQQSAQINKLQQQLKSLKQLLKMEDDVPMQSIQSTSHTVAREQSVDPDESVMKSDNDGSDEPMIISDSPKRADAEVPGSSISKLPAPVPIKRPFDSVCQEHKNVSTCIVKNCDAFKYYIFGIVHEELNEYRSEYNYQN